MKISYGKNVYGLKEIEAVTSQLRKTTQMGKSVTKFEKNISKKFSKSFGLMVNSGSSAIMLALKVLNLKPGDVFIQAGDRCSKIGHAITVVDIIKNNKGDKKYILAQSYMPGQENQILLNQETGDVWYNLNYDEIITPEWSFNSTDLKRFKK